MLPVVRQYFIYILASHSRVLYVGVTNDLARRLHEHRSGTIVSFTARYHVVKLVHFETTNDVRVAIAREKQLKGWPRARKERLINRHNSGWRDLEPTIGR